MGKAEWRLILSPPESGAWNMALDHAILDSVIAGEQPPTLRLYSWEPACLSLGHAQPVKDVDFPALESRGWNLVRRPTGGRAILHTDELTYSVCAHQDDPVMAGGILESYRRISKALVGGLAILGIEANADSQYAIPAGSAANAAVCFEVPSNYEITAKGKKLIGSAQARRSLGVLQHGSLPLYGDLSRITEVLHFADGKSRLSARERLLMHAITAEDLLGTSPTWDQAALSLITAFTNTLQIKLKLKKPSQQETSRAKQLVGEKYGNPDWTFRI